MWWIVGIIILIAAVSSKRFRIAVIALVIIAIAFVIHPSIGIIASIAGLIMSIRCYVFTKEGSYLKYNFRGYEEEKYSSNQTSNENTPISQPSSKTYSAVNKTTSVVNHTNPVANKPSTKSSTNSYSSYNKMKEYDKYGFDQDGINRETGTKRNKRGFDKSGKNRYTGTNYDSNGYDIGWYSRTGYNKHGLDKDGYDRRGFDKNGIHKLTGTKRDENGFNKDGIHKVTGVKFNENFNDATYYQPKKSQKFENRFDSNGINKETGTKWDKRGFDKNGINKFTGDKYDENGYDCERYNRRGFNKHGYNREGYDRRGFDKKGIHKDTGIEWDKRGFNVNGINKDTGTIYSIYHFDINGKNEFTGTKYDEEGFDVNGYNILGMDREGYKNTVHNENIEKNDANQKNTEEKNLYRAYNDHGFDKNGFDKQGYHKFTGKIYNEQGLTREQVESGMTKKESNDNQYNYYSNYFFNLNEEIKLDNTKVVNETKENHVIENEKYDMYGFDEYGIHKETQTKRDKKGFDVSGINIDTGTMYSIYHFDRNGINEFTGTKWDEDGYNEDGYNHLGLDRNGQPIEEDKTISNNLDDSETATDYSNTSSNQVGIENPSLNQTQPILEKDEVNEEEIKNILREKLHDDIYTTEYVNNILQKNNISNTAFKNILNGLGYRVRIGYIIKKGLSTFNNYIDHKIMQGGVIHIDSDLLKIKNGTNYNIISKYCQMYELFKVNDGLYISWKEMEKKGIDTNYLDNFFKELKSEFSNVNYFSIKNIKEKIDISKINNLGFEDTFIENIVYFNSEISSLNINKHKLYSYVIKKPTISDFIIEQIEKERIITISDLCNVINKEYKLDLNYNILKYYVYLLPDTVHYESDMDTVYLDEQDFINLINQYE